MLLFHHLIAVTSALLWSFIDSKGCECVHIDTISLPGGCGVTTRAFYCSIDGLCGCSKLAAFDSRHSAHDCFPVPTYQQEQSVLKLFWDACECMQ